MPVLSSPESGVTRYSSRTSCARVESLMFRPSPWGASTMNQPGYKQFCPVAMAAEILCNRWTMVLMRELVAGTTRFNDLRRGVPKMSPTLLSQRLKELEAVGILERREIRGEKGIFEYRLTEAARTCGPWSRRWASGARNGSTSESSLKNLDPSLLMWDMRRNLNPSPLPPLAQRGPVPLSGPARIQAQLVAGRSNRLARSTSAGPIQASTSISMSRPTCEP